MEDEAQRLTGASSSMPVTSPPILLAAFGSLTLLTLFSVGVTAVDIGSPYDLAVSLLIAALQIAVLLGYFMRLVWDKKLHAAILLGSFAVAVILVSVTLHDRSEYQDEITLFDFDQKTVTE